MSSPSQRHWTFWLGVVLMASSFAIYLVYPVILLLPLPASLGAALLAGGAIVSWSLFFAGTLLAGKEGYALLKRLASRGNSARP